MYNCVAVNRFVEAFLDCVLLVEVVFLVGLWEIN